MMITIAPVMMLFLPSPSMKYEDLHPVHIAFILTVHKSAPTGVRKVGLCYLDTGEPYDDLIELVLVHVPAVIKESAASEANDLYIFARFFAVNSPEEAAVYAAEFTGNELGGELISMYNSIVTDQQKLQTIENEPYFTQRLTEAQLAEVREEARAEARAEAEARGEAKGRAEGRVEGRAEGRTEGANLLAKLIKKGYDVDTALKMIEEDICKK